MQKHEGEEAEDFGFLQQFGDKAAKADCFGGEISAAEGLAGEAE